MYLQVCMSKCAALINSLDLEVIAHTLTKAQESLQFIKTTNIHKDKIISSFSLVNTKK